MAAAGGQGRRHRRQVAAVDQHRALLEVELEGAVHRRGEHPQVMHQVGDRPVAVAGGALGQVDGSVDPGQRPAGVARHQRHQLGDPLAALDQEAGGGDGAGVDHRVVRAVLAVELDDRVEPVAGGLDAEPRPHRLRPQELERPAVDERLRQRLQRELVTVVAGAGRLAADRAHRHRQQLGIDLGELGDVARDLAAGELEHVPVDAIEARFDVCETIRHFDSSRSR